MKLVNAATKQEVDVPDEQAADAYRSGQFGFRAGARVPVTLADGSIGTVDAQHVGDVLDGGGNIMGEKEAHHAELEAKYEPDTAGKIEGFIGSRVAAFARGASLGATDALAPQSLRERLAAYKELHPVASATSELAGMVAPALVGDEAPLAKGAAESKGIAGAAREALNAISAPSRVVSELGGAASRTVARNLGDGVAARIAGHAAQGAVDNAFWNVAQNVDEASLGDHDYNAERLLAGTPHALMLGGLIGGGLGVAGETGKAALKAVSPVASRAAEDAAWKSLGPKAAASKEAQRITGGTRAVGRELLDRGIVGPLEEMAPKIAAAREEAGTKIGEMLEAADNAGLEGVDAISIQRRVAKEVMPALEGLPSLNKGAVSAVDGIMVDLLDKANAGGGRLTFRETQAFRRNLDEFIKFNAMDPRMQALKGIRGIIESELETAGDRAAKQLGADFLTGYKGLKASYQRLAIADKAAQSALTTVGGTNIVSLRDAIAGAAGLAGGLTHGPLGLVTGPAAALASRYARTNGTAIAAKTLDKLATITGIEKATAKIDSEIAASVKGFVARAEGKPIPKVERRPVKLRVHRGHANDREEYEDRAKLATVAATNQVAMQAAIQQHTAQLDTHAPRTAKALEQKTKVAANFLASKLPKATSTTQGVALAGGKPVEPSPAERAEFLRYARAVDDPISVVHDLQHGRLSREGVEAMKVCYPKLYDQVRTEIGKSVAEAQAKGHELRYVDRLQLGILFDLPTDWSLKPDSVAALQKPFAEQNKPPTGHGGGAPSRAQSKVAQREQSGSDRVEGL
ncbi:MAG TPA: hypothetical protein VI390_06745 [Methyloceanibacter sp.]